MYANSYVQSNNKAARAADKQEDLKHYHNLIKLWRQEDNKFLVYAKNLIVKYEKDGRSAVPLLKAIEVNIKIPNTYKIIKYYTPIT